MLQEHVLVILFLLSHYRHALPQHLFPCSASFFRSFSPVTIITIFGCTTPSFSWWLFLDLRCIRYGIYPRGIIFSWLQFGIYLISLLFFPIHSFALSGLSAMCTEWRLDNFSEGCSFLLGGRVKRDWACICILSFSLFLPAILFSVQWVFYCSVPYRVRIA
jgi:hypothetical protein